MLNVSASTGVGVGAKLSLGWEDTRGFRMVGASGQATMGLTAGASIFVGRHAREPKLKIIFALGNFASEIVVDYEHVPAAAQPQDEGSVQPAAQAGKSAVQAATSMASAPAAGAKGTAAAAPTAAGNPNPVPEGGSNASKSVSKGWKLF
jgi:hypothetical protein